MDILILHSFILFVLFDGISCQNENNAHQLEIDNKVAALKELVKSLLETNIANQKQVEMLSNDIQKIKMTSQGNINQLKLEILSSKKSLKNAMDKISKLKSYSNSDLLPGTVRRSLVEFEAKHGVLESDANVFSHNKVTRAVGQNRTIAFSVIMGPHKENLAIHQTLKFDNIITNDGNGYDPTTSIFKAPVSGLYYFSVVIMSHAREDIETEIVKNGQEVVNTYSGDSTTWNAGPQSTVLQLNVGDRVYVRMLNNPTVNNGNVRVFGYGWSSFNGFLISR